MAGNTFGQAFRVTTFGESHGPVVGVIIDGCPSGMEINTELIKHDLSRRRPGQSRLVSQRKELDTFEIIAGVYNGKTTGAPLAVIIPNSDVRPGDYAHLADAFRPSHADYTYFSKYGHRDHRGGGRASARETAARVAAGAIAKSILKKTGTEIKACVSRVGGIITPGDYREWDFSLTEKNEVRCPDNRTAEKMKACIEAARKKGDTVGGVVFCLVSGVPAGWGEPVFDKLHAELAKAMMSIHAAKGFEYGSGFAGSEMTGSEHNDIFYNDGKKIRTRTNFSGGIQGGISNGEDIYFRVAFKPVATLMQKQKTVNAEGKEINLEGKGRHDPCVLPRAVPVVEAMAAIVLADHYLRNKTTRW